MKLKLAANLLVIRVCIPLELHLKTQCTFFHYVFRNFMPFLSKEGFVLCFPYLQIIFKYTRPTLVICHFSHPFYIQCIDLKMGQWHTTTTISNIGMYLLGMIIRFPKSQCFICYQFRVQLLVISKVNKQFQPRV